MSDWGTPSEAPQSVEVSGGEFFPPLLTGDFRDEYRLPVDIPPPVILGALRYAVIAVLDKLSGWILTAQTAGITRVDEFADGENKIVLWKKAVFCEAKAYLLKECLTVDRKPAAENAAKTAPETERFYRVESAAAIRLLTGRKAVSAETI